MGNSIKISVGKPTTRWKEGRRPEGCITVPRNTRLQETSWGREELRCRLKEVMGPEGAVVPYVVGWKDK